jgi:hypothetical protein
LITSAIVFTAIALVVLTVWRRAGVRWWTVGLFVAAEYVGTLAHLLLTGRLFAAPSGELTTSGSVAFLIIGIPIVAVAFRFIAVSVALFMLSRTRRLHGQRTI